MARLTLLLLLFIIVLVILTERVDISVRIYKLSYSVRVDLLFLSLYFNGYKYRRRKRKKGILNNRSLIKPLYKSSKFLTKKSDFTINRLVLISKPEKPNQYTKAVPLFASFGAFMLYLKLNAKSFIYRNNSPTLFTDEQTDNQQIFDGVLSTRLYHLIISVLFFLYSFLINKILGVKRKWDKAG